MARSACRRHPLRSCAELPASRFVRARAEVMLALAPHAGVDLDLLELLRRRFEQRLGMLDAAEPAHRLDVERLVAEDFEKLATAYKRLAAAVEGDGTA